MSEYQPNSHKSRAEATEAPAEKRAQKVVSGKVKTKKNDGRKLANMFISEDAADVKSYIIMDVLVPTVKKAISDIATGGIDILLYGKSGSGGGRKSGGNVSYRKYYDDRNSSPRGRDYRASGRFDYEDLVFESRGEAEAVREQMVDLIDRYGFVTVADMYDMADIAAPYTSNKYGWTNIRNAEVIRNRDGYVLKLPRYMPIE